MRELSILVKDYILKNINFEPINISTYKYSKIYKKVIISYQYKEKNIILILLITQIYLDLDKNTWI